MLLLAVVVVAVGPLLLARLPLGPLQVVIGTALLLFGLEWLRKGVLRLAGRRSPSNSFQEYLEEREALEGMAPPPPGRPDWPARVVAGKGVLLEGVEVVLIVAALGAGPDGLAPAIAGAAIAVVLTIAVGVVLHRPLMRLPESHLKYAVGIVLSSFGVFFLGEGLGVEWPLRRRRAALRGRDAARGLAGPDRGAGARAGGGLMRALRKLVFGETVVLPVGVALVLVVGAGARRHRRRRGGITAAASSCSRSWSRCWWSRSLPRTGGAERNRLEGRAARRPRGERERRRVGSIGSRAAWRCDPATRRPARRAGRPAPAAGR